MKKPDILIAFDKVKKVINSCTNHYHILSADKMIDNFKALYGANEFSRALDAVWFEKLYEDDLY
jgi:hypothetical protein